MRGEDAGDGGLLSEPGITLKGDESHELLGETRVAGGATNLGRGASSVIGPFSDRERTKPGGRPGAPRER